MTPHDIHYGLAAGKWQRRAEILRAAYQAHPERFPRGVPVPPPLPTAAWINKPLTAPALTVPEGILRAQAQRDRLQDQAAYPAGDDPDKRPQEGESRRLAVEPRGPAPAGIGGKTWQWSRSYAGQPIRRPNCSSAHRWKDPRVAAGRRRARQRGQKIGKTRVSHDTPTDLNH